VTSLAAAEAWQHADVQREVESRENRSGAAADRND
jgi:hypothetical protein